MSSRQVTFSERFPWSTQMNQHRSVFSYLCTTLSWVVCEQSFSKFMHGHLCRCIFNKISITHKNKKNLVPFSVVSLFSYPFMTLSVACQHHFLSSCMARSMQGRCMLFFEILITQNIFWFHHVGYVGIHILSSEGFWQRSKGSLDSHAWYCPRFQSQKHIFWWFTWVYPYSIFRRFLTEIKR